MALSLAGFAGAAESQETKISDAERAKFIRMLAEMQLPPTVSYQASPAMPARQYDVEETSREEN